jgi:type II secretory pathway pseudopilin PulG
MSMRPCRQGGFTYLGLIILVTVIGLVGAATLKVDALLQRAAAEEELLAVGAAFSAALESYAAATPRGQPAQPPSLRELLKDPRTPALRRHLRKIFVDPMTGGTDWGIVWLGDHVGVLGVYSLSQAKPLKVGNFDARFVGFDNKQHLSDWKFMTAATAPLPPGQPPAPPLMAPAPEAPAAPLAPPLAEPPAMKEATPPPEPPAIKEPTPPEPPAEEDKPDDPPAAKEE